MNRNIIIILLIVIVAAAAGAWFTSQPKNIDTSQFGVIRFGVDAPYPPYEFFDSDGNLTGFEVELGNKLCEHLSLKCEWIVTGWDNIIPDLNANKFDVIMSSMSITKDRAKVVSFSDAYYSTPSVFFARKGDNINGVSSGDLSGKKIAVQSSTLQYDLLVEEYGSSVKILALEGWNEVEASFRSGEADVVFTDYPQWEEKFMLEGVYEVIGEPVNLGKGVGLAFRKSDDDLRNAMDQGMDFLKTYGEYGKIRRKYFLYEIIVK